MIGLVAAACGGGSSGGGTTDAGGGDASRDAGGDADSGGHLDSGSDGEATDAASDGAAGNDGASDADASDAGPASVVAWEDTYDGIHYFQTFDDSVTDVATEASHSVFVWGAGQPVSAYRASSNPKIVLSYYMPWAYDPDATHDLTYWKNLHPDWILYQCDMATPAYYSGTANMPLDISNPAVVAWQAQTIATPASAQGFDAIAADEFQLGGWGGCGIFQNGVWKQLYTSGTGDPQADQDAVAWLHGFRTEVGALAHPMGLIPNFQYGGMPLTDTTLIGVVANTDGILDECSFTDCSGGNLSGQDWTALVAFIEYVQTQGKAYMAINEANTVDDATVQWVLASYLMGKEHAAGVFTSGVQQYGIDLWRSEYGAAIGAPCAAMQSTQGAYARSYKTGVAIVNPSASSVTFTLPAGTFTDLHGTVAGSTVTLGATSGIVLIASAPQC
jgi:hypothetical protein